MIDRPEVGSVVVIAAPAQALRRCCCRVARPCLCDSRGGIVPALVRGRGLGLLLLPLLLGKCLCLLCRALLLSVRLLLGVLLLLLLLLLLGALLLGVGLLRLSVQLRTSLLLGS